jgi:FixJ family two-component response regulator
MKELSGLVYVIEPDFAVRDSLRFALEVDGFRVQELPDAASFAHATHPFHSCLVLADELIDKSGMSGIELAQRLRETGVQMPIVLLASRPCQKLSARAKNLRITLVEKPTLDDKLLSAIREALGITSAG